MPHVLIKADEEHLRGDFCVYADPAVISALGESGDRECWIYGKNVSVILDKLETFGFKVISTVVVKEKIVWTLHGEAADDGDNDSDTSDTVKSI